MKLAPALAILALVSCSVEQEQVSAPLAVESVMPADRLAKVKAALPRVAAPSLRAILESPDTFWYDHESMKPAYQQSSGRPDLNGAAANENWFQGLAIITSLHDIANRIYDRANRRWHFPFATTAGMDESRNAKVVNFLSLPKNGERLATIPYWVERQNGAVSWMWNYPNGAVLGEVIFVVDAAGELLPSEIRTRTRYKSGWGANAYRPFPRAADLAAAVKAKRPDWAERSQLRALVTHLESDRTLTAKRRTATSFTGTFDQAGHLDVLPEFGDDALVRELLRTTPFRSAYGTAWKQSGDAKTWAASTRAALSIVPANYEAGLIEVDDDSCMRCHKEGGRFLREWYQPVTAYGEIWGKDGIFSFHPFDESRFSRLSFAGEGDNRRVNQTLVTRGLIEARDPAKHRGPLYERQ